MQSYPADYGSGFYAGPVDMSRSFNITQIKFMQELGLNPDFLADLSDAAYVEIEEKVVCCLQISGIDSGCYSVRLNAIYRKMTIAGYRMIAKY